MNQYLPSFPCLNYPARCQLCNATTTLYRCDMPFGTFKACKKCAMPYIVTRNKNDLAFYKEKRKSVAKRFAKKELLQPFGINYHNIVALINMAEQDSQRSRG